ncbi:MAG TPA: hypothetical protein VGI28_01580 [Stellaceae bacterium]|jgi:hypothetical protein
MTTAKVSCTIVSTPPIGAPAAERDDLAELLNNGCATLTAMEMRQSLQVIVSAHDVLARRLRGDTEQTQLALIKGAALQLARTIDELVEVLPRQEASDVAGALSCRQKTARFGSPGKSRLPPAAAA